MTSEKAKERPLGYAGNLVLPLVILAMTAAMFALTLEFPEMNEEVGAEAVPHLWILFTAVFCIQLIVQAARRKGKADPIPGKIGFVFLFACWLAFYVLAIELVGYFVSTFVFLIGSMYMMSYRRFVVMGSVALGWLVFSYVVFSKILFIPLPIGGLLRPWIG